MTTPHRASLSAHLATGLDRLATGRRRLVGLSVARVGIGVATLYTYLTNLPFREALWGPHGDWPYSDMQNTIRHFWIFSVYQFSRGDPWFQLMFFTGIAVTALWTVYGGKPLTVLHAVFFWSLSLRNPAVWDGGEGLEQILVLFMCFQTTNACLGPSAGKVRARLDTVRRLPRMTNLGHNVATWLFVFQVCVVYVVASMWKVSGPVWQHGTALYYISHVQSYSYLGLFPKLMDIPALSVFVSYLTIAVQLMVVPAVFTRYRRLREGVLVLVAGMHLGIMFGMGLVSFGLTMLAADATLLRDDDYAEAVAWVRARTAAWRVRRSGAAATMASESSS